MESKTYSAKFNWNEFVKCVIPKSSLDKILGCFYGIAIGDAVGLKNKFKFHKDNLNSDFPYEEQVKDHPLNDWSISTDHLVLILQSMIDNEFAFNEQDIATKITDWVKTGFTELNDSNGIGLTGFLKELINDKTFTENPIQASASIWVKSGKRLATNGSCVRSIVTSFIPLAHICEQWSASLSMITHCDPRCISSCVFISSLINGMIYTNVSTGKLVDNLVEGVTKLSNKWLEKDITNVETKNIYQAEYITTINNGYTKSLLDLKLDETGKSSYVFKCLGCALYTLHVIKCALENNKIPSFRKVISTINKMGGDADINCAISGAILGSHLGYSQLIKSVPDWINALPNLNWLNDNIIEFSTSLNTKLKEKIVSLENEEDATEQKIIKETTPSASDQPVHSTVVSDQPAASSSDASEEHDLLNLIERLN
jgi:ADP-ribosylglycohydrolase